MQIIQVQRNGAGCMDINCVCVCITLKDSFMTRKHLLIVYQEIIIEINDAGWRASVYKVLAVVLRSYKTVITHTECLNCSCK